METQFTNDMNNQQTSEYVYYTEPETVVEDAPDPANRKYGLGKSIAATIVSVASIIFSVIAIFFITFGVAGVEPELDDLGWSMLVVGIIFSVIACVTAIISLVLGIKSIFCFKKVTPRPIATLILGICATATAAESLVVVLMDIFYAFIIFAALIFV